MNALDTIIMEGLAGLYKGNEEEFVYKLIFEEYGADDVDWGNNTTSNRVYTSNANNFTTDQNKQNAHETFLSLQQQSKNFDAAQSAIDAPYLEKMGKFAETRSFLNDKGLPLLLWYTGVPEDVSTKIPKIGIEKPCKSFDEFMYRVYDTISSPFMDYMTKNGKEYKVSRKGYGRQLEPYDTYQKRKLETTKRICDSVLKKMVDTIYWQNKSMVTYEKPMINKLSKAFGLDYDAIKSFIEEIKSRKDDPEIGIRYFDKVLTKAEKTEQELDIISAKRKLNNSLQYDKKIIATLNTYCDLMGERAFNPEYGKEKDRISPLYWYYRFKDKKERDDKDLPRNVERKCIAAAILMYVVKRMRDPSKVQLNDIYGIFNVNNTNAEQDAYRKQIRLAINILMKKGIAQALDGTSNAFTSRYGFNWDANNTDATIITDTLYEYTIFRFLPIFG